MMRTIGQMRIVTPEELPAILDELGKERLIPEEIERRRMLSAEGNKIVDDMEPLEEDITSIVRREQG